MLNHPDLNSKVNIHMLVLTKPAKLLQQKERLRLLDSQRSQPTMPLNSRLLLPKDQFQSPLKPTPQPSNTTVVVSSTTPSAELTLTTVLLQLDTDLKVEKTTTSSETHGAHHGEKRDISESPLLTVQVSAVSKWIQSGPQLTEIAF